MKTKLFLLPLTMFLSGLSSTMLYDILTDQVSVNRTITNIIISFTVTTVLVLLWKFINLMPPK